MSNEFKQVGTPPEGYINAVKDIERQKIQVPKVKIYSLAEPTGWDGFRQAIIPFLPTSPQEELPDQSIAETEKILKKGIKSGIFVDRYREYLKDLYKLDDPKGISLDEYIDQNDRWENSVIVERSWKEGKRRFVRVPKEEDFERVARSRNTLIISEETQARLREQTFAIGGMGVGSAVGYLLVLSGAKNFRVADGGSLEPHNLNRFIGGDVGNIGSNLAILWAQMAYEANPFLNIHCEPKKLSVDGQKGTFGIDDFLRGATMGIEEMDDLQAKRDFRELAKTLGIPVLMVSDLARKGGRVAFARDGVDHILRRFTPETLQMLQDSKTDRVATTKIAIEVFIGKRAPREHLDPLRKSAIQLPFWPQSGTSAFVAAAGGVNTILDYLEGRKVPRERTLNLWNSKKR